MAPWEGKPTMTTRPDTRCGALVVASFVLMSGGALAGARDLSFDERVAAQRAVEQVYWDHRDWPAANSTPKPPLQAVLPEVALRAKVDRLLRLSAQLEARDGQPLTGDQLQEELDRMARETKAPDTLREIFAALHDDPFLIAECVARPALVQRLLAATNGVDRSVDGLPSSAARRAGTIAPPPLGYSLPVVPAGGGCTNDTWSVSQLTTASGSDTPSARQLHTTVWTGAEMIVWGGWDGSAVAYNSGGRFDPATDSWTFSSLTNGAGSDVPSARFRHTAVWTGTKMIVWGGRNVTGTAFNNGGVYDPATDTWSNSTLTTASGANVPSPRQLHTAVWSGSAMIVWGGTPDTAVHALNNGGSYDPVTDAWATSDLTTGTGSDTPVARIDHTAVWTGTEMIVWGGLNVAGAGLANGGRYAPATDSWAVSSLTNGTGSDVPSARHFHTAVWSGSEMIVWGGAPGSSSTALNTGGRYDPAADLWTVSSLTTATGANVPAARQNHTAVWTGSAMIVWGGSSDGGGGVMNNGGQYAPASDAWSFSSLTNAAGSNVPSSRQLHTAIFTGASDHRMIVWGGGPSTNTGGLYCAACATFLWFGDADGDGHGDPTVTQVSCTQPPGYVASSDDCDDTDPARYGGATELCNGIDDDCDTIVDNGGNAICADADTCSADVCDPATGCLAIHQTANLDTTGFSAARVDGRDLVVMADAWNSCPGDLNYDAAANLDQGAAPPDSCIDLIDFHLFMASFGRTCP